MYDADLVLLPNLLHQLADVHDGSEQQENDLTVGGQGPAQAGFILNGGDDRGIGQELFCTFQVHSPFSIA